MWAILPSLGVAVVLTLASRGGIVNTGATGIPYPVVVLAGTALWQTFSEALEGLLKTMHKGTRHVGKVPETLRQTRDLSDRLKLLQKKLTKAVEEEDFEEAATLRDEIKQTTARLTTAP